MSGRPWYKRYGGDFISGTLGLSLEEKGAYSLVLDLIYDRGGPIPDDPRYIAGVCGCSVRRWNAIRERLLSAGKIVATDGRLSNARAEKEIKNAAKTARKFAENGSKGGEKRAENARTYNENNELSEAGLKHRALKPEARYREDVRSTNEQRAREFADDFWPRYPHKVGKPAAARAFIAARAKAELPAILAGLDRYVRDKPPDRSWCNPATWLNQERWLDRPASTGPPPWRERQRDWTDLYREIAADEPPSDPPTLDLAAIGRG